MKTVSERLNLAPDILEGATVVNMYGKHMALVENYKSIIDILRNRLNCRENISNFSFRGRG